ncbi:AmmeMemoRadiSam system radical SAM enzyme [Novipirellula artificiosorum]|uniref:Uncharacterized protein n=1 Tax=Novipirellula artificiosorum TaxID=2528016 RepID=A0A5C6DEK8_9BACT|nr:AmmeMemoRadiSam system radical SAM enzyme [Novipirellula artificiosorum]TWU35162.1 hypothetical protein Poly41_43110 [Novipirellula artificiosorum]
MITGLPQVSNPSFADYPGRYWTSQSDGRIHCRLCPRECRLKPGDRGFCFVRVNRDGQMVLDTYGRSTGFCIDPIEKKPLNHFYPGTPVLSFGTAGCNLGCKFCQNWDSSKSREVDRASAAASPDEIAAAAAEHGCRSVAFTYNDPVIWAEYAIDTAVSCHALGLKTVAVTAGYITPEARGDFYEVMDAANIDLKGFSEAFYYRLTGAHLDPVLDTIRYVCRETDCWVELTNLIIPHANDSLDELRQMCDWILENVGDSVPIHFTAFHPDYRLNDRPRTSLETLVRAYDLARQTGLKYVYVGNVHDVQRQSTSCPSCGEMLIRRDWHQIESYTLDQNRCGKCQFTIAGFFDDRPGSWGQRRLPIQINRIVNLTDQLEPEDQGMETKANETASAPSDDLFFTTDERIRIHRVACRLVTAAVFNETIDVRDDLGDLADRPIAGIFVTLRRGETLRGCCGSLGSQVPLGHAIVEAANRTAKHDPRMAPIAAVELPHLTVSFSILGPSRPIGAKGAARADAIEIGKQGLRIRMGKQAGLLLPVVATERNWNAEQFLDAVCTKAGLPPASWQSRDARIDVFDGIEFGGPYINEEDRPCQDASVLNPTEVQRLADWVEANLVALHTGATPCYYASDVNDVSVLGIVLEVVHKQWPKSKSWTQFSLRDLLPLQSTLFQMTQNAARSLVAEATDDGWHVRLAILSSAIHHGTDSQCELSEIDCKRRALVALENRRWSICYDTSTDAVTLLQTTLAAEPFRKGVTQVYSVVCDSNASAIAASQGPKAIPTISSRPAAVAGTFYAASDKDREQQVDEIIEGFDSVEKRPVAAAMVPHAGLRYSGRIAAEVWRRVELPETVLIIGPKHTADGVDWAVAPHDQWQLSDSASLRGDVELAQRIADGVSGMALDAAAHRREHGIEVQLPLLYRFAPQTKVAAIAMSGGSIQELTDAASELANCLQSMSKLPLLVISSDMNHFADDTENRRRDRMALDPLQRLDPEGLLKVCAEHNISMCGQIPAALVLLTLKAMKVQARYTEIAYATSADVSGDKSRVVGYAGVLFE